MSHRIVKFTKNEDREQIPKQDQVYHLVYASPCGDTSFCTGEFYGKGESSVEYQEQTVSYGGVTCPRCLSLIEWIVAIQLERKDG